MIDLSCIRMNSANKIQEGHVVLTRVKDDQGKTMQRLSFHDVRIEPK